MATNVLTLNGVSLPNGVTNIPQTAVPGGVTQATVTLARNTPGSPTIWPNAATTIVVALEVSYDNAVTWLPGGGFNSVGGQMLDASGTARPSTVAQFGYDTHPTHVRGTMTIANGPLLTNASVVMA